MGRAGYQSTAFRRFCSQLCAVLKTALPARSDLAAPAAADWNLQAQLPPSNQRRIGRTACRWTVFCILYEHLRAVLNTALSAGSCRASRVRRSWRLWLAASSAHTAPYWAWGANCCLSSQFMQGCMRRFEDGAACRSPLCSLAAAQMASRLHTQLRQSSAVSTLRGADELE
jgi:hypothetical protein